MRLRNERGRAAAMFFGLLGAISTCGLVLLGTMAWMVGSRVRVTETGSRGDTRVETPFGNLTVRQSPKFDAAALGVPLYPGAVRRDDSNRMASFELEFGGARKDLTLAVAEYETPDSLASVEAFYRGNLKGARVKRGHSRSERLVLEMEDGSVKKLIALRSRGGRTRISLASVTEAAAN